MTLKILNVYYILTLFLFQHTHTIIVVYCVKYVDNSKVNYTCC